MSLETGKFLVVFLARLVTVRLPLKYLRYSVSVERKHKGIKNITQTVMINNCIPRHFNTELDVLYAADNLIQARFQTCNIYDIQFSKKL